MGCFVVYDSLLPVCVMTAPMAVKAFLALPAEFRTREDDVAARPRDVEVLDDHEEVMAMATKLAPVTPGELLLEASRPTRACASGGLSVRHGETGCVRSLPMTTLPMAPRSRTNASPANWAGSAPAQRWKRRLAPTWA